MKRINFLFKGLLIVPFFIGFLSSGLKAQTSVNGIVFDDSNRNNKKDAREKGIAGVAVSNGISVVLTDKSGKYSLPVGNDNIVFVIKPSGYSLPLNAKNQPVFYYIHKPEGSPSSFKYKGVAPTGKLPSSVNFALIRSEEPENFRSLIFGDPQPYSLQEVDYFSRGIVSELQGVKNVSFGLSLGDLVGDNLDLHSPYIDAVKKVGIPWFNVMGNHDMNYDATADSLSDETFEANFGPANYSFNYGKVHFIVLDDILYPDPRDGKGYWGGFRKSQLDFVENDLRHVSKDKLIVLAFHIPLQLNGGAAFNEQDRSRLFSILKDFPHTLSLSAHTHLQRHNFYAKEDGWLQQKPHHEYNAGTTNGDWYSGELDANGVPISTMRDGTPKGYAFISFKGNQYDIEYKVAGKPDDYQIEVFVPRLLEKGKRTSAAIYANFFMGTKGDKVEFRIDNGKWADMTFTENVDPTFLNMLHRWDYATELLDGRRPSNAVESTHLWTARIPVNLEAGVHQVEVRATDMFGKTFVQKASYELAERKSP